MAAATRGEKKFCLCDDCSVSWKSQQDVWRTEKAAQRDNGIFYTSTKLRLSFNLLYYLLKKEAALPKADTYEVLDWEAVPLSLKE